jgi:putative chitinase
MFEVAPRFGGDMGKRQAQIIGEVGAVLAKTLDGYSINTYLRIAHFLAQTCHESAGFRTTEEFASGDAYEGRKDLGNTKPGDGRRFKGRGLIQLTGRANYREMSATLGMPLEQNPELAGDPVVSLKIACEYWKSRKINADADRDDIVSETKKINGGTNGLADRSQYVTKAKASLSRIRGLQISGEAPDEPRPVLTRGSTGDDVTDLQRRLQKAGFQIAVDAGFGPATELAVKQFQVQNGVVCTGIVDAATWDLLKRKS